MESKSSPTQPAGGQLGNGAGSSDLDMEKVAIEPVQGQIKSLNDLYATKSYATDASIATSAPAEISSDRGSHSRAWRRRINPLRWGRAPDVPQERIVSREYGAGFFSKLTFGWMTPLMTTGYKRPLQEGDIWAVNPDRAVEPLAARVRESFGRRVRDGQKHPLLWALHESFSVEFWFGGFCALVGTLPQVLVPVTLRFLIQFAADAYQAQITHQPQPSIGRGIGLVLGITAMQILQSFCMSHFIYRGMMMGGESRGVLISMIYEKAMVISGRARVGAARGASKETRKAAADDGRPEEAISEKQKGSEGSDGQVRGMMSQAKKRGITNDDDMGWANGRIVNLMSVDTCRIDQASALFHVLWTSPILCLITIVLLLVNLTYSALAGLALLLFGVPALTWAIQSLFRRRKEINKITDQRVSLTQEILHSVRFVKFFGWEKAFTDRLGQLRSLEIRAIQVLLAIRNAINAVSMSLPIFASILSFITYSLSNHSLSPASVFSSLALFNGLRLPLNLMPVVLGQVTDAWSSIKRIEQFLMEEEQEENFKMNLQGDKAIELHAASFTWERTAAHETSGTATSGAGQNLQTPASKTRRSLKGHDSSQDKTGTASTLDQDRQPFKLQGLNLEVGRTELIAVIGSVGSGKSSLLAALAGDMRKTSGEVVLGASRAFCPQYAWIQNTTLRENITFGKDMDKRWYNKVIRACALEADLEMLPSGDLTEIGERGITISGGQKQRLNMARAIYFDADMVLMDDPLSAVDAHVGRHIFDQAILGLLKDKCRILATHQLWVLGRCDRIVWMEGGKIQAVGTFESLMAEHKGFQSLMETTAVEEAGKEKLKPAAKEADKGGKKSKKGAALMKQEDKAESSVPWSVYGAYVRASGSMVNAPLVAGLLLLSQGANIMTSLWLSYWTSDRFGLSTGQYMGIYAGLGALQALLMFLFSLVLSVLGTRASKTMLRDAVHRVLRAPMAFFDTTPLGRITNRFSRDVDVLDNTLTDAIRMYLFTLTMVSAVFALIIAFFHFFAIALVPLYGLFIVAAAYYRASAREVKRFELLLRSHVFAKFSEGLSGVASIRAYGLRARFVADLRAAVDAMNGAYYLTFSNQRWLSIRLDMVGNGLVFTVGILVVTSRFSVEPAISGLVLSYILAIVQMLQFAIRQLAEVENGMNAVERLRYYGSQLDEEAPAHTVDVPSSWPARGDIIFDGVAMCYRAALPLVLQDLTMHVRAGERVAIVGRTGAGKSSVVSALFRLVELEAGTITVDGLDIATVGLHDLRSRLAIIPQDPTLFRGTIRSNLDPFNEHSDLDLWSALRQADLVPAAAGSAPSPSRASDSVPAPAMPMPRFHLDSPVEEDGLNLSLGQRQLMALARALVRNARIIVCDEATSSVDMETDDKIQRTMASAFAGRTVLCIAHRLRTIIAYDRVCVMDAGRIAELDAPAALWRRPGSIFRAMCDQSGIRLADLEAAASREDSPSCGPSVCGSSQAVERAQASVQTGKFPSSCDSAPGHCPTMAATSRAMWAHRL